MTQLTFDNCWFFPLFTQTRDKELRAKNLIVVDGVKPVLRLLKTDLSIKVIICPQEFYLNHSQQLEAATAKGAEIHIASADKLKQLTGYSVHGGVMALAGRQKDKPLTELGPRVIVLNGVNNAENVGAIVRNGHAFAANSMIVDSSSCSPFVRRAIRVSMGSIFKTRVHHCLSPLAIELEKLKGEGYQILAASLSDESISLESLHLQEKTAVILGCEGDGISREVLECSDSQVHIGMVDGIDSLNASVASGIILHQLQLTSKIAPLTS